MSVGVSVGSVSKVDVGVGVSVEHGGRIIGVSVGVSVGGTADDAGVVGSCVGADASVAGGMPTIGVSVKAKVADGVSVIVGVS